MDNIQDGYGIHAQDINELGDRDDFAVVNGCSVSPGTNNLTVQVASGKILFNDSFVSVSAQDNVALASADSSNPRKDIVYLDGTGTAQVAQGVAEAAQPSGEDRRDTFRPAPPALADSDAVVLAEVWVPAGATDITSIDVSDRRLFVPSHLDSLTLDDLLTANGGVDMQNNFIDDRTGYFCSYLNTSQSNAEDGLYVNFAEVNEVNDGPYTVDSNSQVTVNRDGRYRIHIQTTYNKTNGSKRICMDIEPEINGTGRTEFRSACYLRDSSDGRRSSVNTEFVVSLTSGDSIRVFTDLLVGNNERTDVINTVATFEYLG